MSMKDFDQTLLCTNLEPALKYVPLKRQHSASVKHKITHTHKKSEYRTRDEGKKG